MGFNALQIIRLLIASCSLIGVIIFICDLIADILDFETKLKAINIIKYFSIIILLVFITAIAVM